MSAWLAANAGMAVSVLALGFTVGVFTGLFGVGGGFLMTPALNIFLGIPMNLAVGTSVCQVFAASSISLYHHLDRYWTGLRVAASVGLGIPVGAWLGSRVVSGLTETAPLALAGRSVPAVDFILLLVYEVVLVSIGWLIAVETGRAGKRPGGPEARPHRGLLAGIRVPPYVRCPSIPAGPLSLPVLGLLGLFIGFFSGLLGIGGGVFLLPALYYLVGQETKVAARTSLMLVFLSSLFAAIAHGVEHHIRYDLVVFLVIGALGGATTGARLHHRLSGLIIRRYFSWVVFLAAVLVLVKIGLWLI